MFKNTSKKSAFDIKLYLGGQKLQCLNKSNCIKFCDLEILKITSRIIQIYDFCSFALTMY